MNREIIDIEGLFNSLKIIHVAVPKRKV